MRDIKPFTFYFKGRNSYTDFGILASSHDFLLPEKRQRKQEVPNRHGSYDFGAKFYNERILRLRCIWVSNIIGGKSRADIREISYWLSQKGKIELAVEPDKYYIGELYESNELEAHYINFKDGLTTTDGAFDLNFVCEPFAYRDIDAQPIQSGINPITYEGTAESPCLIVLKNTGTTTINSLQVIATRRKS